MTPIGGHWTIGLLIALAFAIPFCGLVFGIPH